MLSDRRKRIIAEELEYYRAIHENTSMKQRLKTIPVRKITLLFNTDCDYAPCSFLGHQLVLKIVDELLDTGE